MTAFYIEEVNIIAVPFTGAAALLRPVVYLDGKYYCVLLGSDPFSGIFGRARTLSNAFEKWHDSLKKHLSESDDEDYIVEYIRSILNKPQKPADLKAFYDQFKPDGKLRFAMLQAD